jgi:hypothetical protein
MSDQVDEIDDRPLRVRMYPQHPDYSAMSMEYRPYVMYMHSANYHAKAINTDELGLRVQYFNGARLDWARAKQDFASCDVLVGNSTVFGVDCSSDKTTLVHYLNNEFKDPSGIPILSLGIRGATPRQELFCFQSLRRFMPPVRRIVLVTGIVNATAMVIPNAFIHADFGVIFQEEFNFNLFCEQYKKNRYDQVDRALHGFHQWIDDQLKARPRLRDYVVQRFSGTWKAAQEIDGPIRLFRDYLLWRLSRKPKTARQTAKPVRRDQFETVAELFDNDMQNWGALARGMNAEIDFVMQPVINWTRKPLTSGERQLFDIDFAQEHFYMKKYAVPEFYRKYRGLVKASCERAGVRYHDANEWLSHPAHANSEIFSDVCHMTDEGNRLLARLLRQKIYRL